MKRIPNLFGLHLFLVATCIADEYRTAINRKISFQDEKALVSIDAQSFTDLILQSNIFVDKTLMIDKILQDDNEVILLTRPRYWGKTVNLDMIKMFLEIVTDRKGNPIFNSSTPNHRLFMNGELESVKLKRPLLIAKKTNLVEKYFGKHPVIFVDFSQIKGTNFVDLLHEIKIRIRDAFNQHVYMIKIYRRILADQNVKTFDKKMAQKRFGQLDQILHQLDTLTVQDVIESLRFLSEILHDYFDSSVFVMIDEYDAPLHTVFSEADFSKDDAEKVFEFYTTFLVTTVKKNAYLEKAILTGRFPLTKEDIVSGLKGIAEYTFLNGQLIEYYGLKSKEIVAMSTFTKNPANITHLANSHFGGYEFRRKGLFIYNPRFIVNYFATNEMSTDTWLDISLLKNFIKFFMTSEVPYFERYWNAFQPEGDGFSSLGGHGIRVSHLDDEHFTRNELSLLYQALTRDYNAAEFNETLYKLDLSKFADKSFLFLYNMGYFSLMDTDRYFVYMEYPLKNRSKCEKEFFPVLDVAEKWDWIDVSGSTTYPAS